MGMDVYGKDPINKAGEYFRRNVWGWHPLWEYVEDVHPEIAELVEHAHTNDGDGLNKKDSLRLAEAIQHDIKSGKVADYVNSRNAHLASLPLNDCELCQATGIRTDEVGVQSGQPEKELSDERKIVLGRDKGWCNGCDGLGKTPAWETNYHLYPEDLVEFAQFLQGCGGFEIC